VKYYTRIGDREQEYRFLRRGGVIEAHCGDRVFMVDLSMIGDGIAFSMLVDGTSHDCVCERDGQETVVMIKGRRIRVQVEDERERAAHQVASARPRGPMMVEASMPGIVVSLEVSAGDTVSEGQTLMIIEAMKMQNPIQADGPGTVQEICVQEGEAVAAGATMMKIEGAE
jgi:biotin carboxyl carrier protein